MSDSFKDILKSIDIDVTEETPKTEAVEEKKPDDKKDVERVIKELTPEDLPAMPDNHKKYKCLMKVVTNVAMHNNKLVVEYAEIEAVKKGGKL